MCDYEDLPPPSVIKSYWNSRLAERDIRQLPANDAVTVPSMPHHRLSTPAALNKSHGISKGVFPVERSLVTSVEDGDEGPRNGSDSSVRAVIHLPLLSAPDVVTDHMKSGSEQPTHADDAGLAFVPVRNEFHPRRTHRRESAFAFPPQLGPSDDMADSGATEGLPSMRLPVESMRLQSRLFSESGPPDWNVNTASTTTRQAIQLPARSAGGRPSRDASLPGYPNDSLIMTRSPRLRRDSGKRALSGQTRPHSSTVPVRVTELHQAARPRQSSTIRADQRRSIHLDSAPSIPTNPYH